jgi:beta-galactosidase
MKLRLALLVAALVCLPLFSQSINPDWFPKKDMLTIGTYYYPEAWPEKEWARDMTNIRKLGMEYVHMGEFAWSSWSPKKASLISAGLRRTWNWHRRMV